MTQSFDKQNFYTLLCKVYDGNLTDIEKQRLNEIIKADNEMALMYLRFFDTISNMKSNMSVSPLSLLSDEVSQYDQWLQEMAESEKTAPEIMIPKEEPVRELNREVVCPPREKRTISKLNLFFLALNAAAVLFLVLFVKLVPPKGGIEVATLTDSIDAKWADAGISMDKGERLSNDTSPLMLREGLVELTFDNNTLITVEGPSEFQILDEDMIKLNYGQIYSHVPSEAYGFQICTPHAKIIDLGTEFGIKTGIGDTEVHVLKGQVNLISNVSCQKINVNLLAGSAQKLDAVTGELKEIVCADTLFARRIDSKTNTVWHGQDRLDLADMVGGGNGLGTGKQFSALTLNDTIISSSTSVKLMDYRQSLNVEIHSNPFIDSLFIPRGKTQISSKKTIFTDFPDTSGSTFGCVTNGGIVAGPEDGWDNTLLLDNDGYGISGSPMLHLHSNIGITFDLNQIRHNISNLKITRFISLFGISETVQEKSGYTAASEVDFWVLVDGIVRFKVEHVKLGTEPVPVDIALYSDDRFLSLAVTDSDGSVFFDWGIFAKPELKIISK